MFRTAITAVVLLVGTFVFGSLALLAQLVGAKRRPGSAYEYATRTWARWLLRAAGVKVVPRGIDPLIEHSPRVFIANHVSWFDIMATIDALPSYGFLAKRELEKVPFFGAAARAVGVIYVDREHRKAAFEAIEDAASKVRDGQSVLVFPEGTRGDRYALRPFKKGAFVLAIRAGAPIVPVVIHGTIAVNPRNEFRASPGTVYVHTLEPISTDGMTFDDRDTLSETVRQRMADCLREVYGVDPAIEARRTAQARATAPELSLE